MLIPKDPNDDKNVIVEIRGGAGGDEAALLAGVLLRMYSMYASTRRWKVEMMSANETGIGGYKVIVFMITGKGAYSRLKYESECIGYNVYLKPNPEDVFILQPQPLQCYRK